MSDIIDTASFDQFTDFRTVDEIVNSKSKIIFSAEAYKHLLELINTSRNSQQETGVFFLGKEQGKDSNQIFIDSFTTDLKPANGHFSGGAVNDTRESQKILEKAVRDYGYDCLFHFHVHTAPQGSFYEAFSDQDLKLYADYNKSPWFQYYSKQDIEHISGTEISDEEYEMILKNFLNDNGQINEAFTKSVLKNRKVTYFGMLATPDRTNNLEQCRTSHNNYQLSTVFSDQQYDRDGKLKLQFYRFPNMYYIGAKNKIYRIGDFQRKVRPELSSGRIVSNDVKIQAIGKDPNTGRTIEDIEVGKYVDGQFIFNREFSPTDLSSLTSHTADRKPGTLSESFRQVRTFLSRVFRRDRNRGI